MKKSLLFAAALFAATSGFALDENQVVYTLNGRYVVTGSENLISNGSFAGGNFDGWSVVSATEGAEMKAVFNYVGATEDAPEGVQSISGANTEGIKIALPSINDASGHYVVSVTITAPEGLVPNFNFRNSNPDGLASVQLFNILGAAAENAELPEGTPQVTNSGAWQEIYPGTNTYYFGIDGDDIARSYTLEMLGFDPQLVISDIQIKEANKIADDRQVNRLMDYAKALLSIQGLDTDNDDYVGLQETLEAYAEVGDQPDQETMDGFVEALNEAIGGFQFNLVDDFLPNAADKLPLGSRKVEKLGTIGCWSGFGGGSNRLCTYVGALNEAGHYQKAATWGNGNGCIGITTTMTLQPGTYVFSMDTKAGARENNKNSWNMNAGLSFATETMYVKVNDAKVEENIAEITFVANPEHVEKNTLTFTITEEGSYEIGVKTWAKEEYKGLTYGSCLFMVDARMYGKTSAKYTKAQVDYCADVLGQINAARTNIEAAKAYIENPDYSWCKDSLKTAIALYEPITEEYEKMDSAQIISTLDRDIYVVGGSLEGLDQDGNNIRQLAGEVYIAAAKGIIAAVKFFEAQNKEIEGLTNAIAAAKETKEMRVYGMATGKADLEAAIAAAENKDAELRAADYSEENVAAKNDAIAALNEAVAQFQASIPADCIKNLVDLTGNLSAEEAEVGYLISGANKVGALSIVENYYPDPNAGVNAEGSNIYAFSIGYILGEENAFPNLLRVGQGDATVGLDGIAEDAIVQFTFDYYYGKLTGKYASFKINTTTSKEEGDVYDLICGLNYDGYNAAVDAACNTFEVPGSELPAVGSSAEANDKIAAESNKTSYSVTIDLLTKEMTCNIVSGKGTFNHTATKTVEGVPTQFVVGSNYNNADRRCFFGNLKIQAIQGGEYDGIKETVAKSINNGKIYNAAGMEVKSFVKGINIVNGKKFVK